MLSTYNLLNFWDATHPTSVSVVRGPILRSQTSSGSADALRQLRKFVDRFAVTDVQRLKENDPKKVPIKIVIKKCEDSKWFWDPTRFYLKTRRFDKVSLKYP